MLYGDERKTLYFKNGHSEAYKTVKSIRPIGRAIFCSYLKSNDFFLPCRTLLLYHRNIQSVFAVIRELSPVIAFSQSCMNKMHTKNSASDFTQVEKFV